VGDRVEVYLERNSVGVTTKGQIASQRIYYPENSDDLKLAIFRYSLQFNAPLASEMVDLHRETTLENSSQSATVPRRKIKA
jgi:hypothetical protein